MTGSFITPQVRRMGPDGLRGLFDRGLTRGVGFTVSIRLICLSLALLLCVTSPYAPRLKSKQDRSWLSPRNLAIWGLERNFFPQGLQGGEGEVGNGGHVSESYRGANSWSLHWEGR